MLTDSLLQANFPVRRIFNGACNLLAATLVAVRATVLLTSHLEVDKLN